MASVNDAAICLGSARVSRVGDGVLAFANFSFRLQSQQKFVSARRRKPTRETRALPRQTSRAPA